MIATWEHHPILRILILKRVEKQSRRTLITPGRLGKIKLVSDGYYHRPAPPGGELGGEPGPEPAPRPPPPIIDRALFES